MYKIYDDVLSSITIDKISTHILSREFSWYFTNGVRTVSKDIADKYPNFQNSVQLFHPFLSGSQPWKNGGINGIYVKDKELAFYEGNLINSMIIEFFNNLNKSFDHFCLHRCKANLLIQSSDSTPNPPHIDIKNCKHKVIIFYVNDSDGDTILYEDVSATKIVTKISPKKGRILFFDGDIYHSSTPPYINEKRIVLNINLIDRKDLPGVSV